MVSDWTHQELEVNFMAENLYAFSMHFLMAKAWTAVLKTFWLYKKKGSIAKYSLFPILLNGKYKQKKIILFVQEWQKILHEDQFLLFKIIQISR